MKQGSHKYLRVFLYRVYLIAVLYCLCSLNFTVGLKQNDNQPFKTILVKTRRYGESQVNLGEIPHHVLFFKLYKEPDLFRAFCAGSIITSERVITSSNCFLTNQKRYKQSLEKVFVVSSILTTLAKKPYSENSETRQWRSIQKLYSQRLYRYPAFNLCIAEITKPWIFNSFVNKIPYASIVQNFDGVCETISVTATKSWAIEKAIFKENLQLIQRQKCERLLLRNCGMYYCTVPTKLHLRSYYETVGGGLVCHGTGDPDEINEEQGILVAVTAVINEDFPSLHSKIGLFHRWVTDESWMWKSDRKLLVFALLIKLL